MDKSAIALVLDEIGTMLELQGENLYRARAYYGAARALDALEDDVVRLATTGELTNVRGLGPATVSVVLELVTTGRSTLYDELRRRTPEGLFELLQLPGLGARRIHQLYAALGVASLDDLERAAREGRIAELPGFGARTQEKLLAGIAFARSTTGRRRQPEMLEAGARLLAFLTGKPEVVRAELAGAARRRLETVDAIDAVAAVRDRAAPVLAAFLAMPGVARAEPVGETAARARLVDGLELRLRCTAPDEFAAALVHATGNDAHVAALSARAAERGLRLNEYGLWRGETRVAAEDEAGIYAALGLAYIEPELREGLGEIDAAAAGTLPRLIRYEDLRGCFHCHTSYSDGRNTVAEMAQAARGRGWRYLGIADHSKFAAYAGGLTPDRIAAQHAEIDAWNAEHGGELWLFKGMEADILPDGSVDYDDAPEILDRFDYVVASVHSALGSTESEMTRRVLRALACPHVTILGHPTGRLLLSRTGARLDLDAVIAAAAKHGVALELNADPRRLDLDWRHWPAARQRGVRAAINPDAHSAAGLENVVYGINMARKGWLAPENVVNAWPLENVQEFFARTSA